MNAAQIAETFGIPAGTVRSQLSRALNAQESILPTPSAPSNWHPTAAYLSLLLAPILPSRSLNAVIFSTIRRPCGLLKSLKLLARRALNKTPIQIDFVDEFAKHGYPYLLRRHRQAPHKQQVVLELLRAVLDHSRQYRQCICRHKKGVHSHKGCHYYGKLHKQRTLLPR